MGLNAVLLGINTGACSPYSPLSCSPYSPLYSYHQTWLGNPKIAKLLLGDFRANHLWLPCFLGVYLCLAPLGWPSYSRSGDVSSARPVDPVDRVPVELLDLGTTSAEFIAAVDRLEHRVRALDQRLHAWATLGARILAAKGSTVDHRGPGTVCRCSQFWSMAMCSFVCWDKPPDPKPSSNLRLLFQNMECHVSIIYNNPNSTHY